MATLTLNKIVSHLPGGHLPPPKFGHLPPPNSDISHPPKKTFARRTTATPNFFSSFFGAENAKINVTNEPYFGTYILCNYLPFSKADKGAQGGPQQHETPKHSPTDISKRLRS